jgi:hypothetical protein
MVISGGILLPEIPELHTPPGAERPAAAGPAETAAALEAPEPVAR